METGRKVWDKTKSAEELYDTFKKMVQVNHLHNKSPLGDLAADHLASQRGDRSPDFFNFVSIIIRPEEGGNIRLKLYDLYDRLDFSFLLSFFFRERQEELQHFNVETIERLKKIIEDVR